MDETIELLAGTPPGGGQDRAARALVRALPPGRVGAIEVVNLPGRGGGNVWDRLAERPGDPRVVGISSPTLITNLIVGEADIDDRSLTPLANLYTEYLAFIVRADSVVREPAALARELASCKARISLATALGNINHLAVADVVRDHGGDPRDLEIAVFDSARHVVGDIVAGGSDIGVISTPSVVPELEAGVIRVITTTAPIRLPAPFADVPTWVEEGVDCRLGTWRGLVGPADLGDELVASWTQLLTDTLSGIPWQQELTDHGWTDTATTGRGTRDFLELQRSELGSLLAALDGTARRAKDPGLSP